MKTDKRPKRYSWAPGDYLLICPTCHEHFAGDKRANLCADCAYALPDPLPAKAQDQRIAELEKENEALKKERDEWKGIIQLVADLKPFEADEYSPESIANLRNAVRKTQAALKGGRS
jgi:hypothetical protein